MILLSWKNGWQPLLFESGDSGELRKPFCGLQNKIPKALLFNEANHERFELSRCTACVHSSIVSAPSHNNASSSFIGVRPYASLNRNEICRIPYENASRTEVPIRPNIDPNKIQWYLCIRQRKPWTPPPQGSTQIRRWDNVESWGVYFQGLVNLDLINFLTMWIFTLCEFRPGES